MTPRDSGLHSLLMKPAVPSLQRLVTDRRFGIENLVSIANKERGVVPFHFNRMQDDYWKHRTNHDIVVKARQLGFSSLPLGEFLLEALCAPNTKVGIIAHEDTLATKLMSVVKFFWESMPEIIIVDGNEVETVRAFKIGEYSQHVISWPELGSEIRCGTAGSIKFGRGTPLHRVLATEVAFWDPYTAEGVLAAVESAMPTGGRIVLESTANGAAGVFYSRYQAAKQGDSIYKAHFYDWSWDPTYRYERGNPDVHTDDAGELTPTPDEEAVVLKLGLDEDQLRFRRTKQKTLGDMVVQEYAEDDTTAFIVQGASIFDRKVVDDAIVGCRLPVRRLAHADVWQSPIAGVRYIVGVDVSSGYGLDPEMGEATRRKLRLDYSAAIVINQATLEHVATLHGTWDTKDLGERIVELAILYNNALLAVEANGAGDSVLNTVVNQCGYTNIYYSQSPQNGATGKWGWWTDKASKPMMVDEFRQLLESGAFKTYDVRLLAECRTYSKLSPVKVGALPGAHDDIVSAAMIACIVRAVAPRWGTATITRRFG